MSLWIASGDSETYQLSKFSLLDLQEKSVVSQTTVNSEMLARILFFANSIFSTLKIRDLGMIYLY